MTDRDVITEIGRILTDERYQPGVKLWLIAENVRYAKSQWASDDAASQAPSRGKRTSNDEPNA